MGAPALLLALAAARGATLDASGHVKSFVIAGWPYEWAFLPADPFTLTTVSGRLALALREGEWLRVDVHPEITAGSGAFRGLGGIDTGTGVEAPEALPLTWDLEEGADLEARLRVDRAAVTIVRSGLEAAVGRQPVSFGEGRLFTPLDLVAPFTPTTLDTEYKPGVDAVRVDAYAGTSTQVTVLGAYLGDWRLEESAVVVDGRTTLLGTDLALFAGLLYHEPVLGASVSGAAGPVGLYGDLAVTLTDDGSEVRGVAGALWRPTDTTTVTGELYGQTFGEAEAEAYFALATDERWTRGDLWLYGHAYAGLSVAQEVTPLVGASALAVVNVLDPSALLGATLTWSAAVDADLAAGVFAGAGKRPVGVEPRSEFGLVPVIGYLQTRLYF